MNNLILIFNLVVFMNIATQAATNVRALDISEEKTNTAVNSTAADAHKAAQLRLVITRAVRAIKSGTAQDPDNVMPLSLENEVYLGVIHNLLKIQEEDRQKIHQLQHELALALQCHQDTVAALKIEKKNITEDKNQRIESISRGIDIMVDDYTFYKYKMGAIIFLRCSRSEKELAKRMGEYRVHIKQALNINKLKQALNSEQTDPQEYKSNLESLTRVITKIVQLSRKRGGHAQRVVEIYSQLISLRDCEDKELCDKEMEDSYCGSYYGVYNEEYRKYLHQQIKAIGPTDVDTLVNLVMDNLILSTSQLLYELRYAGIITVNANAKEPKFIDIHPDFKPE